MAIPITQNPVFDDPIAEFDSIPAKGEYHTDFSYFDTGIGAHIQGMGHYAGYFVFTHNRERSQGYWGIGKPNGDLKRFDFSFFKDYRHPGGLQVIGDYAVVGIERSESNNNEGLVALFDLRPIKDGKESGFLPWASSRVKTEVPRAWASRRSKATTFSPCTRARTARSTSTSLMTNRSMIPD